MPSVTVSTVVRRPIDEVFDFVSDNRNDPIWAPLVTTVELVEGDAPGEGTVYVIGQREAGRVAHRRLTTTAFHRPDHLSWRMPGRGYTYTSIMDLEDLGPATRIIQTNSVQFRVPLVGVAWKLGAMVALRRQFTLLVGHLEGRDEPPPT